MIKRILSLVCATAIAVVLFPSISSGANYNLNVAPCDSMESKPFTRDFKFTATGGIDTLQAGATLTHVRAWLTAGAVVTFDAKLITWSGANTLRQRGTAPPSASQSKANWGGVYNSADWHTYAVTDVCEFEQNSPVWRGIYVQATAGTVINISFVRKVPVAPIR